MTDNLALVVKEDAASLTTVKRIVRACEDVKGQETTILDVHSISDVADYFVVVSGRSDRQVQGITNRVVEELCRSGVKPLSVEGYEDGQWVLVDCGDVVVHIFYEPVRALYDIESLWMRAKRLPSQEVA
ncbi:MAG: ribosome silencing factor [Pseudomonadota bacterium]|jgi:ribosome-associated protein